ncbi:MAG: ribose 5-phosphate isomerase B [Clostridiales bacterium]|jgi:ribose 5-phosphate isomerase B|nr:ribose 5-phosphate isomerase B [Clostridiales bacterium]
MIALGTDHGGFHLKEAAKEFLKEKGIEFIDFGIYEGETADYPDIASVVCEAIQSGKCECGLLFCGTGIGMSIAANKHKGIRAACCSDYFSAKYTRIHNDANVLCLGGRVVGAGLALELIDAFLGSEFEGGRHARRIDKITEIENKN